MFENLVGADASWQARVSRLGRLLKGEVAGSIPLSSWGASEHPTVHGALGREASPCYVGRIDRLRPRCCRTELCQGA
ncbi:hypothetical protein FJ934_13125 [Mesorhizobium sp. B2-4-12]|nr:hypothetical protein FJ934_13125 [Mesorhizobium sp. B2-4-12]TPL07495.1 hypothetical protein FJ938_10615 [Mesorhizobium sp. B2-4-14]